MEIFQECSGQLIFFQPDYIKDSDCTISTPVIYGKPDAPIYGMGKHIEPRRPGRSDSSHFERIFLDSLLPLEEYDLIIVLFSGGKDSTACYYKLLEMGVPKDKIELWHHDIDGGHPSRRMDWRCTQNYVRSFADAEEVTLRVSYRVNGFFGELYRIGASEPIQWIEPETGDIMQCRLSPNYLKCLELKQKCTNDMETALKQYGYRMKFPAKSGDLSRRWCSAYLKIAVADSVITNLDRLEELGNFSGRCQKFPAKGSIGSGRWCSAQLKRDVADSVIRNLNHLEELGGKRQKFPAKGGTHQGRWCSGSLKASVQDGVTANLDRTKADVKVLVVSGERRGESAGRALYNEMEIHRTNAAKRCHRIVHQWRPVIDYSEKDVWEVLRRHKASPHPCYRAGWNRCSCAMCIFSTPKLFAGIRELYPEEYAALRQDEIILGFTLDNGRDLDAFVGDAKSCVYHGDAQAIHSLVTGEFAPDDVYVKGEWRYPAGAFHGAEGGPC